MLSFYVINSRRFFSNFLFNRTRKFPFIWQNFFLLKSNFYLKRDYMDLTSVINVIEEKLPKYLAESWDNTGLLIDSKKTEISSIFFTNDLTEAVLDEALGIKADLIISYHPPLFTPIKSLKNSNWKDRIVIKCIENSIAVYSPHTSCDAVADGVNDWLISSFDLCEKFPIHPSYQNELKYSHMVDFSISSGKEISQIVKNLSDYELCSTSVLSDQQNFRVKVNKTSLNSLIKLLNESEDASSISIITLNPLLIPSCGMGRKGILAKPLTLKQCIKLMKTHLKLDYIRFAQSASHSLESLISTVAVCAGSGSSVLKKVDADLYITGEMSHHDLLDANHRNVSVILCEHSNSERGYLKHLIESLKPKFKDINLILSSIDKDPINII